METLAAILFLVVLSLVGFRLHTHLAVHERRVVAAWDRLDTLLTQRNGLLQLTLQATRERPDALAAVHGAVQDQEAARRRGDLPGLARSERAIRGAWDFYLTESTEELDSESPMGASRARRIAALDQAINEALAHYNGAVSAFVALRRHWAFGPLARLAGYSAFEPVGPPPEQQS